MTNNKRLLFFNSCLVKSNFLDLFCYSLFFVFLSNVIYADSWNGLDYIKNSTVQANHAERLIQHLSLNGTEKILDVGCGDGRITALLAQKVPQGFIIGIDPSPSMFSIAEKILQESNPLQNLKFFQEPIETFTYDEPFDHIITIHVMHWIEDQEKTLKNMYNHLKPGGEVHFIFAPSKEGLPFHKALEKTLHIWQKDFVDFINPQQFFDMETYRKLMVDAGFHVQAIQYLYHESIHDNLEKLTGWVKQWLPHGKHLPVSKQPEFFKDLMNNYLSEVGIPHDTSNPITWGEYVLIVEGKKVKFSPQ